MGNLQQPYESRQKVFCRIPKMCFMILDSGYVYAASKHDTITVTEEKNYPYCNGSS